MLTLPASFDEIARELTVEAAARAALPRVVLLEEPQAAFYAWVYNHSADWHTLVQPGQSVLVCDIGGGTSDFTLIRVQSTRRDAMQDAAAEPSGEQRVQFHRVAVGNHLILGGDNLDLALARHLEHKLTDGHKLSSTQWDVLVRVCQRVKEELLSDGAPPHLTVNLPGLGSRMVGGGWQVEVARDEVRTLLVEGFLAPRRIAGPAPHASIGIPGVRTALRRGSGHDALPGRIPDRTSPHRRGGRSAARCATGYPPRHRALQWRLLRLTRVAATHDRVDCQLVPGRGPPAVVTDRPGQRSTGPGGRAGAAYYGMVRRGQGVRIAANLARSYYIGVESDQPTAVCLVPGNAEPGQTIEMPERLFVLLISQPVEFPLWVSSLRLTDHPGALVAIDREQMSPLPPIRTVLRTHKRRETGVISVRLHARLTEIGTMDLWCTAADRDRSWRLQFDIRAATETDAVSHQSDAEAEGFVDEATWDGCQRCLANVFAPDGNDRPEGLVKQLSHALESPKQQWPTPLLRRIWEALIQWESGRRKTVEHEARWVNLLGFALRPGYGLAVDDWRVAETWRTVQGKLIHAGPSVRNEAIILWRRIAGGLSRGQQQALADPLLSSIRSLYNRYVSGTTRGEDAALRPNELAEIWRLLGSLELLDISRKIELGDMAVSLLPKRKLANQHGPMIWTLGRLGQRVPVYGPLNTVVPSDTAERWLDALLHHALRDTATSSLAVMQLARRSDDRYRDVSEKCRHKAIAWLGDQEAPVASGRAGPQRWAIGHGRAAPDFRRIATQRSASGMIGAIHSDGVGEPQIDDPRTAECRRNDGSNDSLFTSPFGAPCSSICGSLLESIPSILFISSTRRRRRDERDERECQSTWRS